MVTLVATEISIAQSPFWNRGDRDYQDRGDSRYSGSIDRKLDEVREAYRRGNLRDASARLRRLADELDRTNNASRGDLFPKYVGGWSIKRTNRRNHNSGGYTVTSVYQTGKKGLYASLHKGTEEAVNYIRMISSSSWVRRSDAKIYNIRGYQAVMTKEGRLYIPINRDTLLDFKCGDDDATRRDLLNFASALDIERFRWVR